MSNKILTEIKKIKEIKAPEWTIFVKTGVSKQRPPLNPNWWEIRVASILSKINKFGPIGTNRLSKFYGGRKNRGNKPDRKFNGSRNIIRKSLQQLEKAELIKQTQKPKSGKIITKKGKEFLEKINK